MKKIGLLFSLSVLLCYLFFVSCKKYVPTSAGDATGSQQLVGVTNSDDYAEAIYNDVALSVMGVNNFAGLGNSIGIFAGVTDSTPSCFNVSISPTDSVTFPKTITIDFGSGCNGADGHTRIGQIVTVYSGPLSKPGSTATTTFNGFYYDSVLVQGTHIITNNSTADTLVLTIAVQNGLLTGTNQNFIAWNKSRAWKQVAGQGMQGLISDVFSITGSSSGTATVTDSTYNDSLLAYTDTLIQVQWSTAIVQPCIRAFTCPWILQGQNQITWDGIQAILDYGPGTCDNQAFLLLNAYHFPVILQ